MLVGELPWEALITGEVEFAAVISVDKDVVQVMDPADAVGLSLVAVEVLTPWRVTVIVMVVLALAGAATV